MLATRLWCGHNNFQAVINTLQPPPPLASDTPRDVSAYWPKACASFCEFASLITEHEVQDDEQSSNGSGDRDRLAGDTMTIVVPKREFALKLLFSMKMLANLQDSHDKLARAPAIKVLHDKEVQVQIPLASKVCHDNEIQHCPSESAHDAPTELDPMSTLDSLDDYQDLINETPSVLSDVPMGVQSSELQVRSVGNSVELILELA